MVGAEPYEIERSIAYSRRSLCEIAPAKTTERSMARRNISSHSPPDTKFVGAT